MKKTHLRLVISLISHPKSCPSIWGLLLKSQNTSSNEKSQLQRKAVPTMWVCEEVTNLEENSEGLVPMPTRQFLPGGESWLREGSWA